MAAAEQMVRNGGKRGLVEGRALSDQEFDEIQRRHYRKKKDPDAMKRANRNAKRKCVRGVVPEEKLLAENPWTQFRWIEGRKNDIRQFDGEELLSFLNHLENEWPGVTVATLVAKVCLWSWGRKSEVMGLRWENLRKVGDEIHFEIIGKWAVDKWFRIPASLYRELLKIRTEKGTLVPAITQRYSHRCELASD